MNSGKKIMPADQAIYLYRRPNAMSRDMRIVPVPKWHGKLRLKEHHPRHWVGMAEPFRDGCGWRWESGPGCHGAMDRGSGV